MTLEEKTEKTVELIEKKKVDKTLLQWRNQTSQGC